MENDDKRMLAKLPHPGTRISISVPAGRVNGRPQFSHYVGHVQSWEKRSDGWYLLLLRDAPVDGSRPEQHLEINMTQILRLKPVPERPDFSARAGLSHDARATQQPKQQ